MRQNQLQFQAIWGQHTTDWSKACKAGFCHSFSGKTRTEACDMYGITRQAISGFLARNEHNHVKAMAYHALNSPLDVVDMLPTERLAHEQRLLSATVELTAKPGVTKPTVNTEANNREEMFKSIESAFDE